ncbi:hypothetical protein D3C80_1980960 [compost metagenome]
MADAEQVAVFEMVGWLVVGAHPVMDRRSQKSRALNNERSNRRREVPDVPSCADNDIGDVVTAQSGKEAFQAKHAPRN